MTKDSFCTIQVKNALREPEQNMKEMEKLEKARHMKSEKGGRNMKKIVLGVICIMVAASLSFADVGGGDVTFEVKKAGNVTFSHDNHVNGVGLKCTDCHDWQYMPQHLSYVTKEKRKTASMTQIQEGTFCGACHNSKKAFDVKANCNNCHKK